MKYDFSGWATKNDLLCSDGRTIRKGAFVEDDGKRVPLVWQHQHNSPENVLGHAILENRDEGVYAYATFNNTEAAAHAKELVKNGDITSLSIYANNLKQKGGNVFHGAIREVSLVLAGANPGAMIDYAVLEHSDGSYEMLDEAVMTFDAGLDTEEGFMHEDSDDENEELAHEDSGTIEDVLKTFNDKQLNLLALLMNNAKKKAAVKHGIDLDEVDYVDYIEHADGGETVEEVYNSLNEDQKDVVDFLVGNILSGDDDEEDDETEVEHSDSTEGGVDFMKHNVFDQSMAQNDAPVISHSDMKDIFDNARRCGSLKASFEAYADVIQHGVEQLDYLFPEPELMGNKEPEFIKRPDEWVSELWNSLHKTPFSRIKTMFADITEDEARAKGYIKGNKKLVEVFGLLKRKTGPQTVYKLQKFDRDDLIDITDFNFVAWIKKEMRMMLDEELARAVLIGDGRQVGAEDKINPMNIRPVWTDDEFYTIHRDVTFGTNPTNYDKAEAIIEAVLRARKDYRGSGTPHAYFEPDLLTTMLLAKDVNGRRIYSSVADLAAAMRVTKIHEVPIFENQVRATADGKKHQLLGLIFNPADYNVGADQQGKVNMFDDFDIDYNRYSYLIETRCSGALTRPMAALAIETVVTNTEGMTVTTQHTGAGNEGFHVGE